MQDEPSASRPALAIEKQIFPTSDDGVDAQSGQSASLSQGQFVAQLRRTENGLADRLSDQMGQQTEATDFDFR